MVGDATSRYIDAHPSLCEVVSDSNDTQIVTKLDVVDCPKALEVVFTITFATGLIMVRVYVFTSYIILLNMHTFTIINLIFAIKCVYLQYTCIVDFCCM